jgi:hypothetical protein
MRRAPLGQKTRCPYTLSPLSELSATNVEHIFPHAIGGPASYAVCAEAAENSWFGTKVDAPFVDADFVRLARMLLQIRGRSGVPEMRLQGTTEPDGRSIKVTILPDGTHRYRYETPFALDANTGHGSMIISPEDAEREMKRLTQLYAKKNKAIKFDKAEPMQVQKIRGDLRLNLANIRTGILKIAYLAAFEFLGDRFLDDPMNAEWQKGIRRTSSETCSCKLRGVVPFIDRKFLDVVLPPLENHQHAVAVFCVSGRPVVVLKLFNWDLLTACCALSDTSNFGLAEGQGKMVKCDASAREIETIPFMQHAISVARKFFGGW